MSINFELEDKDIAVFRVAGKLRLSEFEVAQQKCEKIINEVGHVKILVITNNFEGWEKSKGWGDWSFADKNDPYIKKIAIVGDEKWKDLAIIFSGKGLRPVAIEYFESSKENNAREWISKS